MRSGVGLKCVGVGVHHHRRAGLDGGVGDAPEDARDVADDPVVLDRALQERGPDAGVVDALAQLAHEPAGDHVVGPSGQEVGQLEEGVDAGGDDEVDVHRGVDALDARDVAAQAEHGGIDDRLDPTGACDRQLLDRVGDADILVPIRRGAPYMPEVLQRLGAHDEDVLVGERHPEAAGVDGAADGLNHRAAVSPGPTSRCRRGP